jgi:hypothetical protein
VTQKSKPRSAAPAPPPLAAPVPRERWQPRFGIGAMMLVMLVCGMMSSAGYYLVHGNLARQGQTDAHSHRLQLVFLLITLASPLLVAAVISVVLQLSRYLSRRRR